MCPIVSKSLLIVLGTLSEARQERQREVPHRENSNAFPQCWTSPRTRLVLTSRSPFTSMVTCLQSCSMLSALRQRGSCGLVLTTRVLSQRSVRTTRFLVSVCMVYAVRSFFPPRWNCTVRRFALVKAHGDDHLPAKGNRQMPKLFLARLVGEP